MLSPIPTSRWNEKLAAHLLNRAGFGGTPNEIRNLTALGPEAAVAHLVDFEKIPDTTPAPDWARPDPERLQRMEEYREMNRQAQKGTEEERRMAENKRQEFQRMERKAQQGQMQELRHWWLQRMARGPRPLQEKLTLFWHGHFATSIIKVRDAYYMWLQNETFRQHAAGSWLQLLTAASKDPAMLIWLDQAQSRKQHPNENFAREVMELFALGEGNYSEKDVTEAARAFTGWTLNRQRQVFVNAPPRHDAGSKTIFGQSGPFNGDDVLRMIVEKPEASRFIMAKLWRFFVDENPSRELVEALAQKFEKNDRQFKPVLRALFLAEEFYAPGVIRNQVKSPTQWLVGSVRLLERELPPPPACAQMMNQMGQELFAPPNVKGWDGGVTWITTNNLLTRYNLAAMLVEGQDAMKMEERLSKKPSRPRARPVAARGKGEVQLNRILNEEDRASREKLIAALERRFLQAPLKEKQAQTLRSYLEAQGPIDEADILNAIRLLMSTPEYQVT